MNPVWCGLSWRERLCRRDLLASDSYYYADGEWHLLDACVEETRPLGIRERFENRIETYLFDSKKRLKERLELFFLNKRSPTYMI